MFYVKISKVFLFCHGFCFKINYLAIGYAFIKLTLTIKFATLLHFGRYKFTLLQNNIKHKQL